MEGGRGCRSGTRRKNFEKIQIVADLHGVAN